MVIWNGLGFLVAAVTFGCCLLANYLLDAQFGEGYYSTHHWAVGMAVFIGGIISSGIGFVLKARTDQFVVDEVTGERMVINKSQHSFFFIPMHWAGIVVAAIGAVVAIADAMKQ